MKQIPKTVTTVRRICTCAEVNMSVKVKKTWKTALSTVIKGSKAVNIKLVYEQQADVEILGDLEENSDNNDNRNNETTDFWEEIS